MSSNNVKTCANLNHQLFTTANGSMVLVLLYCTVLYICLLLLYLNKLFIPKIPLAKCGGKVGRRVDAMKGRGYFRMNLMLLKLGLIRWYILCVDHCSLDIGIRRQRKIELHRKIYR